MSGHRCVLDGTHIPLSLYLLNEIVKNLQRYIRPMGKIFPTPLRHSILDLTYYLFSLKILPSDFPEALLEATKALASESTHPQR